MKRAALRLILSTALFLSACNKKIPVVVEEVIQDTKELTQEIIFLQAKQLGDAAVDFYLGRTINSEYDIVLFDVVPLGDDYNIIQLESAGTVVDAAVRKVAGMALQMLDDTASSKDNIEGTPMEADNPDDVEDVVSQSSDRSQIIPLGYSAEQERQGVLYTAAMKDVTLTEERMKEVFFPDGKVPAVKVMGTNGVTQEFRGWVLFTAQEAGLLDPRLFDMGNGWGVYAYTCSDVNGGKSFQVLDKIFTVTDSDVGNLVDEIAESPKYAMVCEEYKYFDHGGYRAVYSTDPDVEIDMPVRIVVSFTYTAAEGDYSSELEEFLAGVGHVSVKQE